MIPPTAKPSEEKKYEFIHFFLNETEALHVEAYLGINFRILVLLKDTLN